MFFSLKDIFSWGFILWPSIHLYILMGSVSYCTYRFCIISWTIGCPPWGTLYWNWFCIVIWGCYCQNDRFVQNWIQGLLWYHIISDKVTTATFVTVFCFSGEEAGQSSLKTMPKPMISHLVASLVEALILRWVWCLTISHYELQQILTLLLVWCVPEVGTPVFWH